MKVVSFRAKKKKKHVFFWSALLSLYVHFLPPLKISGSEAFSATGIKATCIVSLLEEQYLAQVVLDRKDCQIPFPSFFYSGPSSAF